MNIIIVAAATLVAGVIIGYFARMILARNQVDSAEAKASRMLEDAKIKSKEELLNSKDKAVKILEETKKEEKKRRDLLQSLEQRLEKKEQKIDNSLNHVEKEKRALTDRARDIRKIREEVLNVKQQQLERLEKIASMNKDEAKKVLLKIAEKENKNELIKKIGELEKEKKEELEKEAKNIMAAAMQRYAGSHAADTTTTTVSIPSDELKGRIIGREGRNIKALERLTGAEIIVDDTPEAIVISGFDAIRRETAKIALEKLIEDGRIHPARIEEAVENARRIAESENKRSRRSRSI